MRIRSIKPEFWRSDDIASLARDHRLLFIGLWSYVDDNGVGLDRLADVCADLFAQDLERDFQECYGMVRGGLLELSSRGLIIRYEVSGKRYFYIPSWKDHQRIDKPGRGRYPLPNPPPTSDDAPFQEGSTNTPGGLNAWSSGEGEKGNRGTGEQVKETSGADAQDTFDIDLPDGAKESKPVLRSVPESRFPEFWVEYPRKDDRKKAEASWAANVLKAHVDQQMVIDAAVAYRDDPDRTPKFTKLGATWLNNACWENASAPPTVAPPRQRDGNERFNDAIANARALDEYDERMAQLAALGGTA